MGWLLSAPQWRVPSEFGSNDWRRLNSGWLLESLVLLHVAFAAARKAKVTSLTPRYRGWPDLTRSLRLPSPHCWLGAPHSMGPVGSQTSCVPRGFSQGKGYKGLQDFLRSGLRSPRLSHLGHVLLIRKSLKPEYIQGEGIGFRLSMGGVAKNAKKLPSTTPLFSKRQSWDLEPRFA